MLWRGDSLPLYSVEHAAIPNAVVADCGDHWVLFISKEGNMKEQKKNTIRAMPVFLIVLAAAALSGVDAEANNYLVNGDMETHWEVIQVMNLQYTGTGTDCRLNIDVANKRFQTIVDGSLDIDVDLRETDNGTFLYEEQFQLINYLNSTGRYSASPAAWMGRNRGTDGWGPTIQYSDGWNGVVNLKDPGGQIPEGSPTVWGSYGASSNGSCMFAHSGKYSLHVYDNRPSAVPGSAVAGSPESVNYNQKLHESNPDHWQELLGKKVILSGWVYMPSASWQNDGTPGYLVRIHHGAGGGTITDFVATPPLDQWVYFEYSFTVDPASDQLGVYLFSGGPGINQVYYGHGSAYFDDMSLELPPGHPADINGDGVVNWDDLAILMSNWLVGTQ